MLDRLSGRGRGRGLRGVVIDRAWKADCVMIRVPEVRSHLRVDSARA